MPKLRCLCDHVISLSDIPCKDQWMIISDIELDKFDDQLEWNALHDKMTIVVKCPKCGRLHIFWNGFGRNQTIYKPETY